MPTAREDLGGRLRALRRSANLDQGQLASILGIAQAQVSRIETGKRPISADNMRLWLDSTNPTDDVRAELLALADTAGTEFNTWKKLHANGWDKNQARYRDRELAAEVIRDYACSLIPGLLQNASYTTYLMREVLKKPAATIASNVAARLQRQEYLRQPGARLDVVICEHVLRQRLGGSGVMAEQLTHLANLANLLSVDLAVLPIGTDMPENYNESFTFYEMSDHGESEVLVETFASGEIDVTDPDKVNKYRDLFDTYRNYSLTGDQALDLVWSLAQERTMEASTRDEHSGG